MIVFTPFDPELVIVRPQQVGKTATAVIGFVKSGIQALDHRPDGGLEHPFVAVAQ